MEELFLLPSAGHIALHLHSMSSGGGFCSFCSDLISSPASLSLVSILLGIIPAQGLTSRRQKASFPKSLQTQEGDRMLASFPSRLGKEGFSRLSVLNQGRSSAASCLKPELRAGSKLAVRKAAITGEPEQRRGKACVMCLQRLGLTYLFLGQPDCCCSHQYMPMMPMSPVLLWF